MCLLPGESLVRPSPIRAKEVQHPHFNTSVTCLTAQVQTKKEEPRPPATSQSIPAFYFPRGRPRDTTNIDAVIAKIERTFTQFPQERATLEDMGRVAKVGIPERTARCLLDSGFAQAELVVWPCLPLAALCRFLPGHRGADAALCLPRSACADACVSQAQPQGSPGLSSFPTRIPYPRGALGGEHGPSWHIVIVTAPSASQWVHRLAVCLFQPCVLG